MSKETISLYSVSSIIEDSAQILYDRPRNTRILRLMQTRINELITETEDENVIFVIDFLNNYIDRLWFNLAIDFSYEAGEQGSDIFNDLIRNIGKELESLVEAMRETELEARKLRIYDRVLRLSNLYRNELYELERKTKDLGLSQPAKIKNWDAVGADKLDLYRTLEKCGAVFQSEHALAGGAPSYYFFDIDRLLSDPQSVETVSDYYVDMINETQSNGEEVHKLAFIEKNVGTIGALPLMSSIVSKAKIPGFVVRFRKDFPVGEIKCAYNKYPKEKEQVAIISDVVTAGSGIIKAKDMISKYKSVVPYAGVLYDRGQGASELLKKRYEIEVWSIIDSDELLEVYGISKKKDFDFNPGTNPEADKIPIAPQKIKRIEEELGQEMMNRLKNAKFR